MTLAAIGYYLLNLLGAVAAGSYFLLRTPRPERLRVMKAAGVTVLVTLSSIWMINLLTHPQLIWHPSLDYLHLFFSYLLGLLLFTFYAPFFFKQYGLKVADYHDLMTRSLLLFALIAKWGCLVADCCGGITIDAFTIPLVPIEIALNSLLVIIFFLVIKKDLKYKYLITYLSCRFVIEFWRVGSKFYFFNITQVIIIISLLIIIYYLWRTKRLAK